MDEKISGKYERKITNLLLQPLVQTKLGIYSVLLSLLFAAAISITIFITLDTFMSIILSVSNMENEVQKVFIESITNIGIWILVLIFLFFIAQIILSIVYTHRLVGPTVAFRRHISELCKGNFDARVSLEKEDAFTEVADDLNALAEILKKKYGSVGE